MFGINLNLIGKKNISALIEKQIDDKKIGELADAFLKSIPLEGMETTNIVVAAIYNDGNLHVTVHGAYYGAGTWILQKQKTSYSFKNFLKKIISYGS